MTLLYYKNSQTNKIMPLTYNDFGAAPSNHMHQADSIGIIPYTMGGLQNETNKRKAQLTTWTGPLAYYNYNKLDNIKSNTNGVYYSDLTSMRVKIGIPDWKHGAIPYTTEDEQLEHTWRQIPLNSSIFFPRIITTGMLDANGNNFNIALAFNYILPENIINVQLSGEYIIRQNQNFLFTSGVNYATTGWGLIFENKPSLVSTPQKIISSNVEGWWLDDGYTPNDRYGGFLHLRRTSQTSQITQYSYKAYGADSATPCAGTPISSGTVDFRNLKITFLGEE